MSQKAARFSQELLVEGNHDAGDPHHDVIRGAEDHGRHLAMVLSGEAVSQLCCRAGLGMPDHHLHQIASAFCCASLWWGPAGGLRPFAARPRSAHWMGDRRCTKLLLSRLPGARLVTLGQTFVSWRPRHAGSVHKPGEGSVIEIEHPLSEGKCPAPGERH